jgi:hypothetical protein
MGAPITAMPHGNKPDNFGNEQISAVHGKSLRHKRQCFASTHRDFR